MVPYQFILKDGKVCVSTSGDFYNHTGSKKRRRFGKVESSGARRYNPKQRRQNSINYTCTPTSGFRQPHVDSIICGS